MSQSEFILERTIGPDRYYFAGEDPTGNGRLWTKIRANAVKSLSRINAEKLKKRYMRDEERVVIVEIVPPAANPILPNILYD